MDINPSFLEELRRRKSNVSKMENALHERAEAVLEQLGDDDFVDPKRRR